MAAKDLNVVPPENYVPFKQHAPTAKNLEEFYQDAEYKDLTSIIKSNKGLKLQWSRAVVEGLEIFLVMVVGNNDALLIRLGNKYRFPRGFPVLWIPSEEKISYFGFYPKFENDDIEEVDLNLSKKFASEVEYVTFFKKWSGFLGMFIPIHVKGKSYFTITSKNSSNSDSPFVKDALRVLVELYGDDFGHFLYRSSEKYPVFFCMEMVSKNDQVHGARVLQDAAIVTAIGIGSFCAPDFDNGTKNFVDFLPLTSVVTYCVKNQIDVDSNITIRGVANVEKFLTLVQQTRDRITDSDFHNLIDALTEQGVKIEAKKGTILHRDVLGDVLEGLVLNFYSADNALVKTEKVKFPLYTYRTMFLRPITNSGKVPSDGKLENLINTFVNRWVASDRPFFEALLHLAIRVYGNKQRMDELRQLHPRVADHILAADYAQNLFKKYGNIAVELEAQNAQLTNFNAAPSAAFEKKPAKVRKIVITPGAISPASGSSSPTSTSPRKQAIPANVIIVVGPIGSGKSTISNILASQNDCFVHVDGDDLGLGLNAVLNLGLERAPYTMWKVVEVLAQGKTPVLSTGGGVLFAKNRFALADFIKNLTGLDVNFTLLIPTKNGARQLSIVLAGKETDLTAVYNDDISTRAAIEGRIARGEWKKDTDVTRVVGVSVFNLRFANLLIDEIKNVYTFPYGIRPGSRVGELRILDPLANFACSKEDIPLFVQQHRILVRVTSPANKTGHITYAYNTPRKRMSLDGVLRLSRPRMEEGQFWIANDGYSYVATSIPTSTSDHSHITISHMSFLPKDTGEISELVREGQRSISFKGKDLIFTKGILVGVEILAAFAI